MVRYWIHPITIRNWETESSRGRFLLGMHKRWTGLHKKLSEGDFVVYYIMAKPRPDSLRSKKIAGIFRINSTPYEDSTPEWPDGVYPLRANLDPVMLAQDASQMLSMKPLVPKLRFIRNKKYWGSALQIGLIQISESDFRLIKNELSKTLGSSDATTEEPHEKVVFKHSHTSVEWALVFLGKNSGYETWIARTDRNKTYLGKSIGTDSLQDLPDLGVGSNVKTIVENIDVLWLRRNKVVAAFEVEHTTDIHSGLTRMNDLVLAAPNLSISLYIVAPDERKSKFERELNRPSFEQLQASVQFIPYSKISEKLTAAQTIIDLGGKLPDRFLIDDAEKVS